MSQVVTPTNQCNSCQCLQRNLICRISKQDLSPKRSADSYAIIFLTLLHRIFVELLFSKPSKNSVSLTVFLSCNFKGLVFDFYLNRKWISVGWQHIVATYQWAYIGRNASQLIAWLCQICYKYCGIRRYRLSLVSLQIADWLLAEIFENSVWKSAEQIPLRVLRWFSQS